MAAASRTRRASVVMATPAGGSIGAWMRGFRFPAFTIVMIVVLIVAVLVLAPTLRLLVQQRQQIDDLRDQVAAQQAEVKRLNVDTARWSDPAYIRAQARDRLFFVMPGETSYLVIDDRSAAQKAATTPPVSTTIQKTRTSWTQSLAGSFLTAGTSTAPPSKLPAGP